MHATTDITGFLVALLVGVPFCLLLLFGPKAAPHEFPEAYERGMRPPSPPESNAERLLRDWQARFDARYPPERPARRVRATDRRGEVWEMELAPPSPEGMIWRVR